MRLLLITPSFFGYERDIARAFESHGASVHLVDERVSNSSFMRAVLRAAPWLAKKATERHFRNVLREVGSDRIDGVLVVKGENTPAWFLTELREKHPEARFVYYTFDSRSVSGRGFELRGFFDRAFSFDRQDVRDTPGLEYKPLFFTEEFTAAPRGRKDLLVSFVGTLHSDRFEMVRRITRALDPSRVFSFFYVPAAWYFWFLRATAPRMRMVSRSAVSTKSLTRREIADVFARSQAVIDIQRSNQSGLTMRTFEVLASGAALITTNPYVKEEDFFDPRRVLVVDPSGDEDLGPAVSAFVEAASELEPVEVAFLEEHSLSAWARHLLDVMTAERTSG